ncbi:efflux transporter outer membrane subunit [Campylobacter fetus]|uniref:RND transporter n=1 Tax=Campylobacter fetus subsp. testudinum TaxID=1507806 RepID=A0AAX0HA22_CAMFE|nr:TolC family protein [Campylobacter fetus]AGZ81018.1 multidrug efflux system CmeABC, outer membrane lipoprotein CmeC [Campylobacter fetus subsp. testudinum 03-427]AJB44774.1 RND transporter [Campylobacter fetus subsp. testudinum]ALV64112.1 multidrug efflux system CmeABC, outer membrane lipoprotein CmeC [Campylobacter fetus subsp. testudinum Sp3]AVK80399.1 TolC family protein [Campylobacter fetus subsp. testudinum]EAI4322262.1 TolC family protein [Campylobacter fetus]
MHKTALILLIGVFVAGCSLKPDMIEIQQTYEYKFDAYSINAKWWEDFSDERLNSLVAEALKNNSDLLIALNNIEQAKINLNLANVELFPNINLNGEATKNRSSGETYTGQDNKKYNAFSLGAALSYEIDLWGRVRDNANASEASFKATKYDYDSARLSIASTVANTYFTLISLKEQENILNETLNTYEETLVYRQKELDAGAIDELTYYQAKAALHSAKTQLIDIQTQIAQTNSALSVLVGKNLNEILYKDIDAPMAIGATPEVPSGISSDVLLHRADVASAVEKLKASNFLVGVARAEWLPKLSLTGLFGFSSDEFDRFFINNANTWNVGGSIAMPLLDFGRTKNRVELANLEQNASFLSYDKTVKTAFGEIRTALDTRKNSVLKEKSMQDLVTSQTKVYDLSKTRYDNGYSTHLEFLDSQRNLLSARLDLAKSKLSVATSVVDVYKSLGGGFNYEDNSNLGSSKTALK